MENSVELFEQIHQLQQDYYEQNDKKRFFKKKQKIECASIISNAFDFQRLLNATVFIIPNTSHIFFDYPTFKTYAHPDIYQQIVSHAIQQIDHCIESYGSYEMHLNMNTFSVSAVNRYRECIMIYCNECMKNMEYYKKIVNMHMYNVPTLFDSIAIVLDTFINPDIKSRIIQYSKSDSEIVIPKLMKMSTPLHTKCVIDR